MRVFGYVRVSTEEQAMSGAGLSDQTQRIESECSTRGWDLLEVFEDAGCSAATLKRPALQRALTGLRAGGADRLMVSKLDRLSRSVIDFCALRGHATKEGWQPLALDLPVDPETPEGELMLNVGIVFAQLERRLIGQRTKDALAVKRAAGVKLGRPTSMTDELRERVRVLAAEQGFSGAARTLNDEGVATVRGGVKWWPSTVSRIASQP